MSILKNLFKKKPSALTIYKAIQKQLKALLIGNEIVGGLTTAEQSEIHFLLDRINNLIRGRE
jgi:hypothetical protein